MLFTLVGALLIASVGCGKKVETGGPDSTNPSPSATTTAKQEEVLIKFPHYRTGPSGEGVAFGAQVARFNEKYKGQYKIELEEIPGEQYNDKIKLLYQSGKLPVLYETNNSDAEWTNTLIGNETWLDLAPYIEADSEFKKVMMQQSIDFNKTKDGKIVSLPFAYVKYAYMFYNKDIFQKAGVTEVPTDWASFEVACEKIKASGVTPISFMTGENAWTTMLTTYAYFASTEEGKAKLNSGEMVYDFSDPVWVETVAKVTEFVQKYGSSSALGAKYPDAANAFFTEKAAIMPQGSWFVPDLSNLDQVEKGFDQKIGVAAFPGNIVLGDANGYGMMINKEASEGEIKGLIEFFKFMYTPAEINEWLVAVPGFAENVVMGEEFTKRLTAPAVELSKVKATAYSRTEVIIPQAVLALFPKNLPLLINGDMTAEEMVAEMTATAQKFK